MQFFHKCELLIIIIKYFRNFFILTLTFYMDTLHCSEKIAFEILHKNILRSKLLFEQLFRMIYFLQKLNAFDKIALK